MFAPGMGRNGPVRLFSENSLLPDDEILSGSEARPQLSIVETDEDRSWQSAHVSPRMARFLATADLPSPCLVVDLEAVTQSYAALSSAVPFADVFYAVKANPAPEIIDCLAARGACFDTASLGEIDLVLSRGVEPSRISFGNTIKKASDIRAAYDRGVMLYAFDSAGELDKIARLAPGAQVFARILVDCEGAEWPLSKKFGCAPKMAGDLLLRAREIGLRPRGVSFHVGSQQTDLRQYDAAISQAAALYRRLADEGLQLDLINLGGGFPARYREDVPSPFDYGVAIKRSLDRHLPGCDLKVIVEPGRSIAGDAGVIQAEVVLVSEKGDGDNRRWVYLDIGKFHGLAETMDEAIKYQLATRHAGEEEGPVVVAGPTCDSADVLYDHAGYTMPLALSEGDKVLILATGAYTTTYSSVGFNGFAPLASVCF